MAKQIKYNKQPENVLNATGGAPLSFSQKFPVSSFRTQAIILALIAFIFYCNTFQNEAAFDDRMAITDNEYVQAGVAGIPDILTKDAYQSYLEHQRGTNQLAGGRYRPLSLITFAIEQQAMGVTHDNETADEKEARTAHEMHGRHVVNVLLYILTCIVLLFFFKKIVFPESPLFAFVAAVLFTIHPIHTEVVANVKSRDEILSVLFISLTFIKAFSYRDNKKIRNLMLASVSFFLALLSKEYAITLLVLLPLSFYIFRKEGFSKSVRNTLPYLIPLGLYLLLRFSAVSAMAEGAENNVMNNPYLYATGLQKIATEILVLLDYLKLLLFPDVLSADYSYNQVPYTDFSNPLVWVSLAVYIGMAATMCILFTKRHVLCFAIAFYLFNLALVANILFNIGAPMGERLIFHSSISFSIAVAWLICKVFEQVKWPQLSRAGLAGSVVILVVLSGFKTIERNKDWKNDETLFLSDVKNAPNSVLVNNNAAAACMNNAKINKPDIPLRNEWFDKAIKYYDKAISIYPKHILAHMSRGLCYYNTGNAEKALQDWDTARKYEPAQPGLSKYLSIAGNYFYSMGMKYKNTGKTDSAIYEFKMSLDAMPNSVETWVQLGDTYYMTGLYAEAMQAGNKALQIAPKYESALKLRDKLIHTSGPG